jgi:acyl-CoA synthetase (AMP-forming)/AMP-acid ligase II
MQTELRSRTIQDVLQSLSKRTDVGARFVRRNGEAAFFSYADVIERAKRVAAGLQRRGIQPGDRIALVIPTSIEFFDVFLGAQLAGAIPVALYPPFRLGKLDEYYSRTRRMLQKIGARLLVSEGRVSRILGPVTSEVPSLESALKPDDLKEAGHVWREVECDPDSPAFLQFSSGSTSDPKAVIVSHRNLLANLEMMAAAFRRVPGADAEKGGVCWLPLYHDMGLVGCLFNGLYYPATVTYIAPEDFIVQPSIWLRTISQYRSIVSPAPHFAYRLCANKIKDEELDGVDLSSWTVALNGAEPIEAEGMRLFAERFAKWGFRPQAMTPVYGLAEAGLAVTFSDPLREPLVIEFDRDRLSSEGVAVPGSGRHMPSVGRTLSGVQVRIADENDDPMDSDTVGKILVRGESITPGFFNDPELTADAIRNGWLDTGDLGFFHAGELYIAGRAKDLIIIRGRNYAPQEIEDLLLDVPGVRPGCAVAVSQAVGAEGEQLIILAEKDLRHPMREEELAAAIRNRILAGISLTPYLVQALEPGTLPRTSSGKLRRSDALRMFLSGTLVPAEKITALKLFTDLTRSQVAWGKFFLRKK